METFNKDIKHAWRMFRENKLFTATAIAALTLGIGVNIAIFSVVNAVLLQPLPFPDTRSLVSVWDGGHSLAEFTYVRDRSRTIETAATYMPNYGVSLSGVGEPLRLTRPGDARGTPSVASSDSVRKVVTRAGWVARET